MALLNKYLLRSPANFDVLEGLLSAVLGEDIKIDAVLESEGDKKAEDEKFNRVDIKCRNSKGEVIIIEVQNTREADYIQRILFGFSQAVVRHIDLDYPYQEIPKIYSISIVYFKMGVGDDYAYRGRYEFKGVHTKDELKFSEKDRRALGIDSPSDPMPETYFLMVADFNKVAKTSLEEWMRFLKDGTIDPDTKDKGLQAAREKLDMMKMSRDEQDRYKRYYCDAASFAYTQKVEKRLAYDEGIAIGEERGIAIGEERGEKRGIAIGEERGEKRGIAIGEERGEKRGIISVAKKMKDAGMAIEQIMELTSLSKEQIEGL